MLPELTNLLPAERQATLAREYLLRLGTFGLVFLGIVLLAHGAQLAPMYAYVLQEEQVQEERVAELSEQREVSGFTDLSTRIAALSERAQSLEEIRTLPTASDVIRDILALSKPGIALTSFVYTAPKTGEQGRLMLTGTAATRESLRSFDRSLGDVPFVASHELPLSAYARESDIPFEIALTLSFETP